VVALAAYRRGRHHRRYLRSVRLALHTGGNRRQKRTHTELLQYSTGGFPVADGIRGTGLPVATVFGALVMMELNGLVRLAGSMTHVRAR
jgi:predicted Rossmann fold nucleotide-binding protein DprA/Smf involved in DNA uptake